ncbi:UNVERIFIED_CONTAM: hypothetical protein Sradi_1779200 [Sesamum radiatum]|uniref:Reverse transcriptase zinc-binding domain-containing protein n=1 Tax=Sesamum radiatum TaxID=300843 RepID=A0AAW2TTX5_SESRA
MLGVEVVEKHAKYLGLTTVAGRSKRELFEGIKDRFWRKLHSWSAKQLSQAGRAILIKTGGLGFKSLKEFNLALLTKQAWRVSMCPDSVAYTILSHKYFRGSTFFEAKLGSTPSYTWRSLWATRDILAAGIRWQVGNGNSISVTNGRFSVRSAYRLALTFREEGSGSNSRIGWQFIWKSKAPPKVLMFAWRCVQNSLPTADNLLREMIPSEGCAACFADHENILHLLPHCSFARLVWAISGLPWGVVGSAELDVERWFKKVHSKLLREQWDLFLVLCWALWWARNQRIFEGNLVDASSVVRLARRSSCVVAART